MGPRTLAGRHALPTHTAPRASARQVGHQHPCHRRLWRPLTWCTPGMTVDCAEPSLRISRVPRIRLNRLQCVLHSRLSRPWPWSSHLQKRSGVHLRGKRQQSLHGGQVPARCQQREATTLCFLSENSEWDGKKVVKPPLEFEFDETWTFTDVVRRPAVAACCCLKFWTFGLQTFSFIWYYNASLFVKQIHSGLFIVWSNLNECRKVGNRNVL